MSSRISAIYDGVLTALAAMYPNKTRIPNALVISENAEQFLRDGYGLRIDPESPSDSEFCRFSRSRIFTVILSREVISDEFGTTSIDTASKALLEDTYSLQKDFMNQDQIGIESSIELINMAGTSSIIPFIGERGNFVLIEVSFQIQVTDDI
jgi:hypothetical protein